MSATQPEIYTAPLDRSTHSIRLIEILPGIDQGISCRFHVHELNTNSTCPPFIALSYTWGPPDPSSEVLISVDGQPFSVRQNLWCALTSYRKKMSEGMFQGLFWIDALSINQQDNSERSHQVNMMDVIFSRAETVLVWLGPEADDSSLLLEYIMAMPSLGYPSSWFSAEGHLMVRPPKYARYTKGVSDKNLHIIMPRPEFTIDDLVQDLFDFHLDKAFEELLKRDYWTRVWIIQEVLLAENLFILCGDQICSWSVLVSILTELDYLGQILGPDGMPIDKSTENPTPVRVLQHFQAQVLSSPAYKILTKGADSDRIEKREEGWEFNELIQTWLYQKCTDPRDHVYGFLGLAKGDITADYDKTVDEIYADAIAKQSTKLSHEDCVVFVSALTKALYGEPAPEKVKELEQMTGFDIEDALSYFFEFRPLPAWPSEEDRPTEPPIISYIGPSGLEELPDYKDS